MDCDTCDLKSSARLVDYGETTSLGHAIMVYDCMADDLGYEGDDSDCGNYIPIENLTNQIQEYMFKT